MRNNQQQPRRLSWDEVVLLIGHVVIVAALAVSALVDRIDPPPSPAQNHPSISILDSLQPERLLDQ